MSPLPDSIRKDLTKDHKRVSSRVRHFESSLQSAEADGAHFRAQLELERQKLADLDEALAEPSPDVTNTEAPAPLLETWAYDDGHQAVRIALDLEQAWAERIPTETLRWLTAKAGMLRVEDTGEQTPEDGAYSPESLLRTVIRQLGSGLNYGALAEDMLKRTPTSADLLEILTLGLIAKQHENETARDCYAAFKRVDPLSFAPFYVGTAQECQAVVDVTPSADSKPVVIRVLS